MTGILIDQLFLDFDSEIPLVFFFHQNHQPFGNYLKLLHFLIPLKVTRKILKGNLMFITLPKGTSVKIFLNKTGTLWMQP